MNLKLEQRFLELSDFLAQYQNLHDQEFLKKYPSAYPGFLIPWIAELKEMSLQQLAQFESYPSPELVNTQSFKDFLQTISKLTKIDQEKSIEQKLENKFLRKMKPKKCHEVKVLKNILDKDKAHTIVDIGSGAGFLSTVLVKDNQKKSICVDIDKELQANGKKRIDKWYPELKPQIKFVNANFTNNVTLDHEFKPRESTIVGLHSCGPLSNSLIKFAIKHNINSLINFGCCYHRLKNHYNISNLAKKKGVKLTENALHLAEVSSAVIYPKMMQEKIQFKSYRYTLHYYLKDYYQLNFKPIGKTLKSDYKQKFYLYAKKYCPQGLLKSVPDKELTHFYHDKNVQDKVKTNIAADIIRLQLGRVIELYLIIDRALYLKDYGKNSKVSEVFDRRISPRNIMLSY